MNRIAQLMDWIAANARSIAGRHADVMLVRNGDAGDEDYRWSAKIELTNRTVLLEVASDPEIALESLHGAVVRYARECDEENDELDRAFAEGMSS